MLALVIASLRDGGAADRRLRPRIPEWGFKAFLFGFTLIVSGMIFFNGEIINPYSFFYVWAALYALYFFSSADAARHVLFMGFCYAGAARRPPLDRGPRSETSPSPSRIRRRSGRSRSARSSSPPLSSGC